MKILQIAYYYPPMGGAGVQRALKFSKYLGEFGVQPVVLAAHDAGYVADTSLVAELPAGLAVHRIAHASLLQRLAHWRQRAAQAQAASGGPGSPAGTSDADTTGSARRWRDALLSAYQTLQFPDDKAVWARQALRRARQLLREQSIDLIFTSAPPVSAHWIGERLSREFGLPWVADFRDLWTDNPAYAAPAWRRRLDRRLEQRWLQRATGVVTVTESWQRLLAARCAPHAPVAFIPNGYDEADFHALVLPPRTPGIFTLVHTGTFYGPRDPAGLLDGLARYLDGPRAGHPALRVRLIGNMGARFLEQIRAFEHRHPGVIACVPYLPHKQALAELMGADALLLVVGGGRGPAVRGWLPGKIFEYLRAAKPVLTLGATDGDAAELIRRHSRGWVVEEQDAEGVATSLRDMLAAAGGPMQDAVLPQAGEPRSPACFERRELSRQLAEFMRACVAGHGRDNSVMKHV